MEQSITQNSPIGQPLAELLDMGAALHWLHPGQKRPIAEGWSDAPRATRADLERQYIPGANIGIRLGEFSKTPAGYLHLIDLDIRKPELAPVAMEALRRLAPTLDQLPISASGSGGESRHFLFFSPTPLRSEKLAKSEGFSYVFDQRLGREVKKYDWEIDLLGTGKQAVLPPSIHPDTGKPYRWLRPIDAELVRLGIGSTLSFPHLIDRPEAAPDDDDLFAIVRAEPIDVTDSEIDSYIAGLPEDWVEDRDTWLKVGAALSHQYRGGEVGFKKWCAWSRQSEKFNLRDSKAVWRSFKGKTGNPITFRSIIAAANDNRDPLADLLGTAGPSKPSRLTFLSPADCEAAPSRGYVIKGLIAPGDVGCIFGAPGAGKSLLSPFLAYAVAQGREAFGQRVRAGGAFYVAAEDPHGMRGRIRALKAAYGDAPGFQLVEGVSNLHPDAPDLVALIEAVQARKPSIVFIDTLAMAFPGLEENSAESMGNVVAVARKLAEGGSAVVIVHHDAKAEGGTPRGHSILNGALDVALHVKRDEDSNIVRARLTKNRNGPCDLDIAFSIATEDGGTDEDGDTISLPRCRELSADPMRVKLTDRQAAAAAILKCIVTDDPSGLIPESRWRDACVVEGALSDSPNKESRGAIFRTTRKELAECGAIIRLVPEGKTEMHVRLSDFMGLDDFDDLPEQGECSANTAECSVKVQPGQWPGEAEHPDTLSPFRGRVQGSPLPDPKSKADPLAELIG